jgi:WD40 repeat protein
LAYSPDGQWLVSGSSDENAHVLEAATGARRKVITEHDARVPAVAFSPDGTWLATGGHDWRINLWNTATWGRHQIMEGHSQGIYTLQFSEDSRRLLSSGSDGASILWDMETFREVLQIEGWVGAMRPGGRDIITGTRGVDAYLWPAFPWDPETYSENPEAPLSKRVEQYKQTFWRAWRR